MKIVGPQIQITGDYQTPNPSEPPTLSPFDLSRYYSEGGEIAQPKAPNTATLDAAPGRISSAILKEVVEAKTRMIAARWGHEAALDAQAQAAIDIEAEAEIMGALAQEITAEIDQELMVRSTDKPGTPTFKADIHAAIAPIINQHAHKARPMESSSTAIDWGSR